MLNRLFERTTIRLWRSITPHFSVVAGDKHVSVSANNLKSTALLTWKDNWKSQLISAILAIEAGDFIDIGANVGQTLIDFYATGATRRYIGFEPHPNSFASLCTFASENDFGSCVILPVGLSDKFNVVSLYSAISATTDQGASIVHDLRKTRNLRHTPILCCRFDDLREGLDIASIGLIKIDVEGAELQVLRGMEKTLSELRAPVMCEILFADGRADMQHYEFNLNSIMAFLRQISYTPYLIRRDRQEQQFQGLVKINSFPIQVWTVENAHECDYIIIPTEKTRLYEKLMAGSESGNHARAGSNQNAS